MGFNGVRSCPRVDYRRWLAARKRFSLAPRAISSTGGWTIAPRSPLWPTVKHFASWLGLCPNWKKTGGKVKSSQTRKGKNRAAGALRLAAWSLIHSNSYLGAYLRRQRARLGAPKAITATAHKLARIFYTVMRYGVEYQKRTEAEFVIEHRQRMEKNLHRRARELGYQLVPISAPTPEQPTTAA